VIDPDRPPVFGKAGSSRLLTQSTTIDVYDVLDSADQDRIIGAIRSLVAEQKFRPVDLCFLEHENWIVTANSGERDPETQLRRVRVTRNGVRDQSGQRLITYPSP
jgi:hypothetical protein